MKGLEDLGAKGVGGKKMAGGLFTLATHAPLESIDASCICLFTFGSLSCFPLLESLLCALLVYLLAMASFLLVDLCMALVAQRL